MFKLAYNIKKKKEQKEKRSGVMVTFDVGEENKERISDRLALFTKPSA